MGDPAARFSKQVTDGRYDAVPEDAYNKIFGSVKSAAAF